MSNNNFKKNIKKDTQWLQSSWGTKASFSRRLEQGWEAVWEDITGRAPSSQEQLFQRGFLPPQLLVQSPGSAMLFEAPCEQQQSDRRLMWLVTAAWHQIVFLQKLSLFQLFAAGCCVFSFCHPHCCSLNAPPTPEMNGRTGIFAPTP